MKKILFLAASMLLSISVSAQVMKVMQDGNVVATYEGSNYEFVFEKGQEPEPADPNLLPGKFSVSDAKTVQFTKGNLYWNGSDYKFEAKQTAYPTSWSSKRVSHFYWTSIADYHSGKNAYMPYASSYAYSSQLSSDKFFCGEENKITVEGTSDLYALSFDEWRYLIENRPNASSLCKYNVTVLGKGKCLVIAPDDYDFNTNPLKASYTSTTWAEAEAAGLVCLPPAGYRGSIQTDFFSVAASGYYWSSTTLESFPQTSFYLYFDSYEVSPGGRDRYNGFSIRLVK